MGVLLSLLFLLVCAFDLPRRLKVLWKYELHPVLLAHPSTVGPEITSFRSTSMHYNNEEMCTNLTLVYQLAYGKIDFVTSHFS